MLSIPSVLLFSPFGKGFVRQHTRKSGTVVQAHFTKRPTGVVKEKHLKERFHDHDKTSAKKAHDELEGLKAKHKLLLDAAKSHHGELKKKGPSKEDEGISHKEKLSHLKAEIKNQQTHIDNHSRKQSNIKNRYQISSKQIVRKKSKDDLEKRIKDHTDEQKKTIRDIHSTHQKGTSKLEPGKILTGKDKDHIYLETKHKDTGKTHHVAIYKDGSVKDPNVLHGGKFDSKTLKEQRKEKNISVKKPVEKPVVEKEKPKREPKKVVVKKGLPKLKTRESKRITVKKHEKKQKLTANEKSYLNWYSGDGFKELNEYLRKDAPKKNPTLEKYADGLNSAINKDSLDKDTTLYRGINVKKITEAMQNVKSGNKIEISSFQSTTDNPGSASSYSGLAGIVLKINVSKGTNAVDMNKAGASRNPTEKEFLLPNKGHYIVKGIKKPKKGEVGRTIVVVDYIPEGVSEENILKKSVLLEAKEILEKEKSEDLKKSISKKIKRKRQKKNKKKR